MKKGEICLLAFGLFSIGFGFGFFFSEFFSNAMVVRIIGGACVVVGALFLTILWDKKYRSPSATIPHP